ncbi:large subunit of alpha-aminoadipate reductase [Lobulomyces angularis]|nr:large subunit of alpha-aminoadipate reductase [Lobulomyces angularis]
MKTNKDIKLSLWKQLLQNQTELVLPTDYPRPIPHKIVESSIEKDIALSVAKQILNLCIQTDATPFSVLLSAFSVLFSKYTNESDISVGSSSASNNPLVLRFNVEKTDSLLDVIANVLKTEEHALENEIPFADLLSVMFEDKKTSSQNIDLPTSNDDDFQPSLFKVRFFNMTDTDNRTLNDTNSTSNSDLTIFVSQSSTLRRLLPIQIKILYNSVLFSEQRINEMFLQLEQVFSTTAKDLEMSVSKIDLVSAEFKKVIPNPKEDLNWDNFEGSITKFFENNSLKHPEKICVVESDAEVEGKFRKFTYKVINEASNVVAHRLIKSGIQREDVVVLYSYRGVDLVVAVMGVLKAGATFSVIDPAYPPSRQNVYLSVAQPRGVIILKKAGELNLMVREYIKSSLNIICEIPALELHENGSVSGGKIQEWHEDVLKEVENLSQVSTEVENGPDSIGTLSFTSGSTGVPKGVRGRHFSLTHFYPWMKQEFKLNETEKFTMLSGIAHDPIQRDIFTPLYLGAELYIPTSEHIGSPGRLAKWMSENKITVTHLTPAMGQLLSANAVDEIPSLKNSFFVGDVLTKRDVSRLQVLAPNCSIINMYGTTETQRAVSYLTIPPVDAHPGFLSQQKDIMPAGKGMKNVQLLVINDAGLMCGVGEVGEIYVRSGGLAEGYLGLEDVTKEKFISNPFNIEGPTISNVGKLLANYKGPRDRMYRTGDLGRYRPDALVECTGRADDQVKIRGFRIELKEIDTHLSQHPQVRENVTLVRRDKLEEKTLCSYFIPLDSNHDIGELLKDIREYLKLKLPSYAVPTVFVPLTRMPLTPNGKIDKNALPFPDTVLVSTRPSSTDSDKNLTTTEKIIKEIWNVLLPHNNDIQPSDNFFDLGGHSVLATRLVFELRKKVACVIPLSVVFKEPTLKFMALEVDKIIQRDSNNLLQKNDDGLLDFERKEETSEEFNYAADLDVLDDKVAFSMDNGLEEFKFMIENDRENIFFVTGVTGFLGAFILRDLLQRYPASKVICHVRANSVEEGLKRIEENGKQHLVWRKEWLENDRISVACGDLSMPRLGLTEEAWDQLSEKVDLIVHNGALVHWVFPYTKLRGPNVLATVEALKLSTTKRFKPLLFVSSTSVLDTAHYSNKIGMMGESGKVLESDDLEGSRTGLHSGYGQTKWVSEKLIMRAQERGVPCTIIRPGYIVGHSFTGVGNTDDFLWRLVKGCIQLGKIPKISNVVNMVPVDYVSAVIVSVAGKKDNLTKKAYHIWHPHSFRFDDLFKEIMLYYPVVPTEYMHWRTSLMEFTFSESDHALYPLLHFVLDDLPTSTRSPELDDQNAKSVCQNDQRIVRSNFLLCSLLWKCPDVKDFIGLYLGYMSKVGFLEKPEWKELPHLSEWDDLKVISRRGQ